jgi:hypothetical protein
MAVGPVAAMGGVALGTMKKRGAAISRPTATADDGRGRLNNIEEYAMQNLDRTIRRWAPAPKSVHAAAVDVGFALIIAGAVAGPAASVGLVTDRFSPGLGGVVAAAVGGTAAFLFSAMLRRRAIPAK